MSVYDEKMPSYLVMSRGDLIAEILQHGPAVSDHLAEQEPVGMFEPAPELPDNLKRASEIVRIANDVLRERFGVSVEFHYSHDTL